MARRSGYCSSCLLLLALAGCELESDEAPAKSQKVTRISGNVQVGAAPQGAPFAGAPAMGPSAVAAQPQVRSAPAFPVRLSAGTALPQTGPEGTLMSFSVDYVAGEFHPAEDARCVLVVETATGMRAEQPVEVAGSGTWSLFVSGWAPEAAPFQAHVEEISGDGSRRSISAKVPLQ